MIRSKFDLGRRTFYWLWKKTWLFLFVQFWLCWSWYKSGGVSKFRNSFYWNFGYLKSIKLIYFSKINFEIHSKNNCVQLSGDEIVNIISNKLLFKKVEYNNEIISQVRTNIQPLCWAAGKLFLFLARSMGNENWKG